MQTPGFSIQRSDWKKLFLQRHIHKQHLRFHGHVEDFIERLGLAVGFEEEEAVVKIATGRSVTSAIDFAATRS